MTDATRSLPTSPGHAAGHVMPLRVLVTVWGSLLALTALTVAVAGVDLGSLNLALAMLIATAKATLVVLFFMHMRYDRPLYAIVFVTALLFVALFISFALLDSHAYAPSLIPGYGPALPR
jgi:cytochrome c oxidase subunit IV